LPLDRHISKENEIYHIKYGGKENMTKRILSVALAVMMLLIVAFPVSAAIETTKVEVRGSVSSNDTQIKDWNAQTFAGFFYDLKDNKSTESMYITATYASINNNKTIPEKTLYYETGKAPIQFKVNEKEGANVTVDTYANYQLVGFQAEKWIAVNNVSNKIAKLAFEMGKDDKKTLTTGETWSLGSGYEVTINAVDARASPRQVWFTIKKDGAVLDEGIGQAPTESTETAKKKAVYYKKKTILGETDSLLFTVYVDSIFSGATSDMVQFKYAWLIDESSAKEIKGSDTFGAFEVTQATSEKIVLYNKNSISLSQNTETTLMGDMKFKTADSKDLRFYPKVDYVIKTEGEVPTGNVTPTPKVTTQGNVTPPANVSAAKTPTQVTTEAPPTEKTSETPAGTPKTAKTEPGFEMVFAIAGLLAVAFLVLRQRK
jgi:S-layer protein (TIGR01567 family)